MSHVYRHLEQQVRGQHTHITKPLNLIFPTESTWHHKDITTILGKIKQQTQIITIQ